MPATKQRMSFDLWLQAVNRHTEHDYGVSVDDLPDCCYQDWYNDGVNPQQAAKKAVRNANS